MSKPTNYAKYPCNPADLPDFSGNRQPTRSDVLAAAMRDPSEAADIVANLQAEVEQLRAALRLALSLPECTPAVRGLLNDALRPGPETGTDSNVTDSAPSAAGQITAEPSGIRTSEGSGPATVGADL